MAYSPSSPVFGKSITAAQFGAFLRAKGSPAASEAAAIFTALGAVDPSVALGQFGAESSFGTAGYAKTTRNWGNIVISRPALPHWTRAFGGTPWKAPNGRTYAKFATWRNGARAYAALLSTYRVRGWASSIEAMSRKWLGGVGTGYITNIVRIANSAGGKPPTPPPPPKPAPTAPKPAPTASPPSSPPTASPAINLVPEHLPSRQPDSSFALYAYAGAWEDGWSPYGAWVARPVSLPGLPTPPSKSAVYVLVHGGPQGLDNLGGMDGLAAWIATQGGIGVAVKYPMLAEDGSWRDAVGAIQAAIAKGRSTGARVTLVGHSAGGLFLSLVAFSVQAGPVPDRVVYIAADDQVGNWPQPTQPPNPRALYGANAIPVSVIVGSGDMVTTVEEGQAMVIALNKAGHPGRWVVIDPAGHTDLLSDTGTIREVL
ncbi:MAG: hypothetical protein C0498_01270 [Anaerolinea sp.]|nr:hypothetical protein [Anaerolinea sp.]